MNRLFLVGALLLASASILLLATLTPAAAQCQGGGMMSMCMGAEACHEAGATCGEESCPGGGMMGSCMEGEECTSGMMGSCHEQGGGGMGNCQMEEQCGEMAAFCEEMMVEHCGEMGDLCENMSQHRDQNPRHEGRLHVGVPISITRNPFNPVTSLGFSIAEAGQVDLKVYDVNGRWVATLASGHLEAGSHSVLFSGHDLPSGVYLARLDAMGTSTMTKLLLIK